MSVYVHFPYCLKKCPYCDFASEGRALSDLPHERYADAVRRELEWRAPSWAGRELTSIFFGGGTPSLWEPSALARVLSRVRESFEAESPSLEITLECNPTSLDRARAAALAEAGVNRLSIGVQSLDADRLRFLGRLHDPDQALAAVDAATAELDRVSADLMFGMPGQSPAALRAEITRLLDRGLRHVSAYALTIEPGTQFGQLHRAGKLRVATDDGYADLYLEAEATFAEAGLRHYEVSNYAAPAEEARHNQHTWRGGEGVGVGAGAVGWLRDGAEGRRWRNDPRPERYMAASGDASVEIFEERLDADTQIREALMLGLRTTAGVDLEALGTRTGLDPRSGREAPLARRLASGDLALAGAHLFVPPSRWLALDSIVADLF